MKIFLTGGTGFVGSAACEHLERAGHTCVAFDLHPFSKGVERTFIHGDVRDLEKLIQASKGADAILHLAAAHHDFGIDSQTFHDVNVVGTQNVCQAMTINGISRLCFYSTVAVYGESPPPVSESTPPRPVSDYGKTKLLAELVCEEWSKESSAHRCLVIRPTVIFGPNNFANMYTLIRQIDGGRFLRVGRMDNFKSLAYIDNVVRATEELWIRKSDERQPTEIYNYVDKPDLTSIEIVDTIYSALGKRKPALAIPYGLARMMAIPFDLVIGVTGKNLPVSSARIKKLAKSNTQFESDRIHQLLSEKPVPLRDGIREMVLWYRSGGKFQTVINRRPSPLGVS